MHRMSFYCIHFFKFTQCLYCMFYSVAETFNVGLNAMSFFFSCLWKLQVLMFPYLMEDQLLTTEFETFIEAMDNSHELALAGHQQYPVYFLAFIIFIV